MSRQPINILTSKRKEGELVSVRIVHAVSRTLLVFNNGGRLVLMMIVYVHSDLLSPAETFPTHRTAEGFFSSVCPLVFLQVGFLVKSLHAELAGEWPLTCMRPQVDFERVSGAVPLPTQIAAEFFLFAALGKLTPLGIPVGPERSTSYLGAKQSFRSWALQVKREIREVVLREGLGCWVELAFSVRWTGS